ncbi:MAG: hypothetical protein CVU88_08675 [Firmicutes bacterium HGW-Firmicutes-13]|nr:MAG: hypothetical protein CVU88_08675 [Firmicutes bacterium HGW-Firmicutes-13]
MKRIILLNVIIICFVKFTIAQCYSDFYPLWYSDINFPCLGGDYILVLEDNFNGNSLDLSKWDRSFPWGRNTKSDDACYYLNENVVVENGTLKLIAKKEPGYYEVWHWDAQGNFYTTQEYFEYTSGMIRSFQQFKYGKFEIRCRMPEGEGLWPAFWLFGCNPDQKRWNEIDIFDQKFNDKCLDINDLSAGFMYDYNNNKRIDRVKDGDEYNEDHKMSKNNVCDFSDWHTFTLYFDPYDIIIEVDNGDTYYKRAHRAFTQSDAEIDPCNTDLAAAYYCFRKAFPVEPMNIIASIGFQKDYFLPSSAFLK